MNLKAKVLAAALAVSGAGVLGVAGSDLIKSSEGLRLVAYRDPVGIVTACWGHVNPNLRVGMKFTRAECEVLFASDVAKHQAVITPTNPANCIAHARLTNNQRDAVTSLVFNIGNGRFCKSTMARKLRVLDYAGAAKEFPKWKFAGGRVLPGLVTRRAKEQALYNSTVLFSSMDLKAEIGKTPVRASDGRE